MEVEVTFFNSYGNQTVFDWMKDDGIVPNKKAMVTPARLLELSNRYDVTMRSKSTGIMVFLAVPTTFLPGSSDNE